MSSGDRLVDSGSSAASAAWSYSMEEGSNGQLARCSGECRARSGPQGVHHIVWGNPEPVCSFSSDSSANMSSEEVEEIDYAQQGIVHMSDSASNSDDVKLDQMDALVGESVADAERHVQAGDPRREERTVDSAAQDFSAADIFSEEGELPEDLNNQVPGIPLEELLTDAELSSLLAIVPLDHNGSLTSIGSLEHSPTACKKACLFVNSSMGCHSGILCEFCHFTHKRKTAVRPCKGKRDRYRKLVERKRAEFVQDAQAHRAAPRTLSLVPFEEGTSAEDLRTRILGAALTHGGTLGNSGPAAQAGRASHGAASSSSSWGLPVDQA